VLNNNVTPGTSTSATLALYVALFALNAFYMWRFGGKVRSKGIQVGISCFALLVWSFAIGGPVWDAIQTLVPGVELRSRLLISMLPVFSSLALAIYSPDGFVPNVPQRVAKESA
jgi:hypothetical protein